MDVLRPKHFASDYDRNRMPDYSKGKIYGLRGNGKLYVGSTCNTLPNRRRQHRYDAKRGVCITSSKCFENNTNPEIYLIEEYPCSTKEELKKREGYWIDKEDCVNKCISGLTKKETGRRYYQRNKEKILENQRNYNRTEVIRRYYQNNKEKIKTKVPCALCGTIVQKYSIPRHQRSLKCKKNKSNIITE